MLGIEHLGNFVAPELVAVAEVFADSLNYVG